MQKSVLLVIVLIAIPILFIISLCVLKYGKLVNLDKGVRGAWSPLVNVLDKRYDEIPKLAEEITFYSGKEDEEAKDLAEAQKKFARAQRVSQKIKAADPRHPVLMTLTAHFNTKVHSKYTDNSFYRSYKDMTDIIGFE